MRLRLQALIILILVLLVSFPYSGDAYPISTDTSFRSSEIYESQELLPDPAFTMEPAYSIQGSSEEFSFNYKNSSSDNNGGVVSLNWTHVPGTELAFDMRGSFPECQEFVYFTQEFTWDLHILPASLNLSLRYQVTRTDRFLTEYSLGLFEIRFWFIHPDGIWREIATFGGGHEFYRSNSHTISRIYFADLFEKLMTGSDQNFLPAAKLAIGLVPTWRFQEDNGIQLWREFNGSIILDITEMGLSSLHRRSDTRVEVETPAFNNSWQVGSSDSFRDSFIASDDSLYVLTVGEVAGMDFGSTLTRVGFRGNEIWSRIWKVSEGMLAQSVAATPDNVYIIGTVYGPGPSSDVGVYALDVNGDPLWNITLDYSESDYPGDVGINSAGEIFIGISTGLYPERDVLIKLDSTGELLWEAYFGSPHSDRVQDVEVCKNGNIYTRTEHLLSLWADDGQNLWSKIGRFDDAYALENGNVLTTNPISYGSIELTCYNMEGNQEWSSIFDVKYTQNWWDFVTISSAMDGHNDTLFVLLWTYGIHPGRFLLHLDSSGNQLHNKTLSFSEDPYDVYRIPQYYDMYMASNGLLYLVGEYLNHNWDYSIIIGVYDFEGVVLGMVNSTLINSSVAFVLVIVVLISFESKRRISHMD
ncbi:MAG: hypothetical protein ACFFED_10970 [Candidatus Thorarchaeota archaeon]